MDYEKWASEYMRDAKNILATIRKYEKILASGNEENLEQINSTIASYRYIYYDLINTARYLSECSKKGNEV